MFGRSKGKEILTEKEKVVLARVEELQPEAMKIVAAHGDAGFLTVVLAMILTMNVRIDILESRVEDLENNDNE